MNEVFIATESDGSQWVSLEDYNKLLNYKDELRGSLFSAISLIDKHGDNILLAHATLIMKLRNDLDWRE